MGRSSAGAMESVAGRPMPDGITRKQRLVAVTAVVSTTGQVAVRALGLDSGACARPSLPRPHWWPRRSLELGWRATDAAALGRWTSKVCGLRSKRAVC